ncbi:hypothetical protein H8959_008450 [Pygathrix nigripes]
MSQMIPHSPGLGSPWGLLVGNLCQFISPQATSRLRKLRCIRGSVEGTWEDLKRGERNLLGPGNTPLLGRSLRYSLASSVGNSLPAGVPQQTHGFSSSSLNFELLLMDYKMPSLRFGFRRS